MLSLFIHGRRSNDGALRRLLLDQNPNRSGLSQLAEKFPQLIGKLERATDVPISGAAHQKLYNLSKFHPKLFTNPWFRESFHLCQQNMRQIKLLPSSTFNPFCSEGTCPVMSELCMAAELLLSHSRVPAAGGGSFGPDHPNFS